MSELPTIGEAMSGATYPVVRAVTPDPNDHYITCTFTNLVLATLAEPAKVKRREMMRAGIDPDLPYETIVQRRSARTVYRQKATYNALGMMLRREQARTAALERDLAEARKQLAAMAIAANSSPTGDNAPALGGRHG